MVERPTKDLLAGDSIAEFGRWAQQALSHSQAHFESRSRFCPRLSYGRHRGPARIESRQAAVLIAVYPHHKTGRLCMTLTRRPSGLAHHGGQVCLPGGRIEPGETALHAALREYHEELGVEVQVIAEIGRLPPTYVFASDNWVQTWMVTAQTPVQRWQPDHAEVDEVIEIPLDQLVSIVDADDQAIKDEVSGGNTAAKQSESVCLPVGDVPAPRFQILDQNKIRSGKESDGGGVIEYGYACRTIEFVDLQGRCCEIWGATAMLVDRFAGLVHRTMVLGNHSGSG